MAYELSFSDEFFMGDGSVDLYEIAPAARPDSVLQAIISLPRKVQLQIAKDVFDSPDPEFYVDSESFPFDVLDRIQETNTCTNLDSPVEVWIDQDGFYTVRVYQ